MIDKYTLKGIFKLIKITAVAVAVSGFFGLCFIYPNLCIIPLLIAMFMLGKTIVEEEADKQRVLDQLKEKNG
jgi:uncharacterized membrane protein